ncbi:MAG: protease complex subunit PrcB family protein [bacterium]|nr:protease complex subunit PrcB family protein [bacterium]
MQKDHSLIIIIGLLGLVIVALVTLFTYQSQVIRQEKNEEGGNLQLRETVDHISKTKNNPGKTYYWLETENGFELVVSMGEKNTGGYSITIINSKIVGDKTVITVAEKEPGPRDIVTMAFTYPTATMEFAKKPRNLVVQNETGEIYQEIVEPATEE